MKSTYKLFGVFLDHKPGIELCECEVIFSDLGLDYKHPFCLFDYFDEYRTVKITELLSVENIEEWEHIRALLCCYERIAIKIDYIPDMSSRSAVLFYKKKLSQIYYALRDELPGAGIVIQVPSDKVTEWNAFNKTWSVSCF